MTRQEELDRLVNEFEAHYQAFVYRGELDALSVTDEDYEREYRLTVHCVHGIPRQSCLYCRKTITAYMPYH